MVHQSRIPRISLIYVIFMFRFGWLNDIFNCFEVQMHENNEDYGVKPTLRFSVAAKYCIFTLTHYDHFSKERLNIILKLARVRLSDVSFC